jgi:hypothetical protein|tara:strand:- start:814 stop:1143 length:330 start_codon:yes stop_codon:yes gene_type:complete
VLRPPALTSTIVLVVRCSRCAAAARHLLKKNSFFLSFPVDSGCNDCYIYKYRRRANAMTEAEQILDFINDHYEHFGAYPMEVETNNAVYTFDQYWSILDMEGKRHDLQV